jgi:predicted nucleic acid-binding protein
MTKVFIDTDVLLDVFLEREPHHSVALRLLTDLRRRGTRCLTSAVVLANMNYILAKARGREYSVNKLRSLRRMVGVAPIDEAMVDAALAAPHRDFEDSLQFHCANGSGIETLITRNAKHYPKGRLRVTSPVEYLGSQGPAKSG